MLNNSGRYAEAVEEVNKAIALVPETKTDYIDLKGTAVRNLESHKKAGRHLPWLPWIFAPYVVARGAQRDARRETGIREIERQGRCVVTVRQNGPFKTEPNGSRTYPLGTTISIIATPQKAHPFKRWETSSDMILIGNPSEASTWAKLNGPGVITADFS